jgi:thiamine biosynthesis lipoprotein
VTPAARTFPALGTTATVCVVEPSGLDAVCAAVERELGDVDDACSRFRPDSELARLNSSDGEASVGRRLFDEIALALDAARATGGLVDPTIGRTLRLAGYDRTFSLVRLRDGDAFPAAFAPVPGWHTIELDEERRSVRVRGDVELDLGATAKALAADRAAVKIAAATGCGVLVNLGGDISVAGRPPAEGWLVGIADDASFDTTTASVEARQLVTIRDGGLATSSVLGRAWRRGGAWLHHIIDPRTGEPARSCWRTATVAAATCVDANVASTAAILRGEQAVGWLQGIQLPARLVRDDGSVVRVAGWPAESQHGSAA